MTLIRAVAERGSGVLLHSAGVSHRADELLDAANEAAARFRRAGLRRIGLQSDNGPGWVAVDLAATMENAALVPLPAFFSAGQLDHSVRAAGLQAIVSSARRIPGFDTDGELPHGLLLHCREAPDPGLPTGTTRITFTSGTTGQPRGVCLSRAIQERVARTLADSTAGLALRRHLCTLPLGILLENVAGLWAGILRGCEIELPPLADLGWAGSNHLDFHRFSAQISASRADSLILLPQMLKGLIEVLATPEAPPHRVQFAAVGGARTAPALLHRARYLGLPVYEGYGLSECGSVVCLNLPEADRPGSVGRPLPGREIRINRLGRIEIRNPGFLGRPGEPAKPADWFDTGDIGDIDADGFVHVRGRAGNVLTTSFGRNIAPEWIESELLAEPGIAQALVLGDDQPALGALLVCDDGTNPTVAVANCNRRLPDYARIVHWRRVEPFTTDNGLLTANGRIRRQRVRKSCAPIIEDLFRPALRDRAQSR